MSIQIITEIDVSEPSLVVTDIPPYLSVNKPDPKKAVPCLLCGAKIVLSKMRDHVGHHILYSMRNVPEKKELHCEVSIITVFCQ